MARNGNIIALGEALAAEMEAIRAELPVGITVDQIADQPHVVEHSIKEFVKAFGEALAIVLVVSFISLGFRTGLIVALSVPLVLAIVFAVMLVMGIDLNRITLGALIIALGLLVDDAIIAIEMMVVKMEQGWDRASAAAAAWDITAFPMLTGTLVTAAGFIPVGFAASAVAEYAGGIFWVVAIALVVSWIVAVVFTPYLGVKLLPDFGKGGAHDPYQGRLYGRLRAALEVCLRYRLRVVAATAGLFVLAVVGFGNVQQQFFPLSERPELFLQLRLPEGSSITATTRMVEEAEALLEGDPDVIHATTYVGQGSVRFWLGLNPQLPNPAFAETVILSKDTEARERIKARLEEAVADGALSGARVRVDRFNFGPPVGHPVQFRVVGDDPAEVRRIAEEVREAMALNPSVRDPHLQWNEMAPSIRLVVDQDRARALGLAPQDIGETLQTLLSGLTVTEMRDGTDLVAVVARAVPEERLDAGGLGDLTVTSRDGVPVPLSQVARIEPEFEEPILWRRNRDLMIAVRADIVDGVQAPEVTAAILPALEADQGGAAGRLPDRDRRRDRGEREGQRLDLRDVPDHGGGDADDPDDPAAELLAAGHRADHRAARDHRRVAGAQPVRGAVRVRRAARPDRARRDDHAELGDPRRPDRGRRRRRARPADGDRRGDGAAGAAGGADGARGDPRDDPAVAVGVLGADGDGDHGRAAGGDAADAVLPAGALRALVPGAAAVGGGGDGGRGAAASRAAGAGRGIGAGTGLLASEHTTNQL